MSFIMNVVKTNTRSSQNVGFLVSKYSYIHMQVTIYEAISKVQGSNKSV